MTIDTAADFVRFDAELAYRLMERLLQEPAPPDDLLGETLESMRPLVNSIVFFYADEFDREDVAQEVLVHLIAALPTYDHNPAKLKPWLSSIIRRKAIDLWRERAAIAPEHALELRDEITPADEIEYNISSPHAALLVEWLSRRFPSLAAEDVDVLSEAIINSLFDNKSSKFILEHLRESVAPHLLGTQVQAVYGSALVFLRALGWSNDYASLPDAQTVEFSLFPELQLFVGDAMARRLYALFKGTSVVFRIKA